MNKNEFEEKHIKKVNLINSINSLFGKEVRASIYDAINDSDELEVRLCSECGNLMIEGYCIDGGDEYYCNDECLHKHISESEFVELCENDENTYWTEWE